MGKTTVTYKDIAVGASEAATVTASGTTAESIPQSLINGGDSQKVILMEQNSWALDGTLDTFYENANIAFWSSELSNADGTFQNEPVITINFSNQFSSMGVTIAFDDATEEYCSAVNVKWYQGETLKADQDFEPDSTLYFCSKRVESYNKIVITFKKTSLPYRRAKVSKLMFGVIRTFGMNELRNAAITNEMDESAVKLPVSSFKWTLDSLSDVDYLFQLRQPVEVRNNDYLLGVYYIDKSDRTSNRVYKIECKDAVGVLGDTAFAGGAYLTGVSAKTLLTQLAAPFEVEYADDVQDATLKGLLKSGTAREAIQQIMLAWGVCIATDGGEKIRVFNLPETVNVIPQSRTFTGSSVKTDSIVTKVSVTAHTYTASTTGSIEINGQKYADAQTVYSVANPDVIATDKANVKEVKNGTLVSTDNGQTVAQRLYDYYSKRDTISARIVYAGEKIGDCVSIYTPWGTLNTGILHKMEVTLSNTVVYKAEVIG